MEKLLLTVLFVLLFIGESFAEGQCNGKWFNPFTDTNWSGLFPIKIGGIAIDLYGMSDTDTVSAGNPFCFCDDPPRLGVKMSVWEPIKLIEIVRKPGCYPTFNGIDMGIGDPLKQGTNKKTDKDHGKAFYQQHYLSYPVFKVMELALSIACLESASVDVLYMTEVDPMWGNDELNAIINPEGILFGNPITQAVCAADSISSTAGWPIDQLFWCCGTWGSMYPFNGSINHNITPLQTAALSVCRFMAKMHREMFSTSAWLSTSEDALCGMKPLPIIKKSQYRLQLVYPSPSTESRTGVFPLGRSEIIWGIGKWYPMKGEDFAFLLWRKRDCCML
jgi:conjugal transfer pilus assembly protein TraU